MPREYPERERRENGCERRHHRVYHRRVLSSGIRLLGVGGVAEVHRRELDRMTY